MKVEIDINSDTADFLIVENLKQTIADMKKDLKARKKDSCFSWGMFSNDKEEDLVEMAKHIEAFKLTLSYFGVKDE
jgi:hypothetical protein